MWSIPGHRWSDTFVLDEQTGETIRLGGAATRLWPLLARGATPEEAARAVAPATGAPYERVLADTVAFTDALRKAGIQPSD